MKMLMPALLASLMVSAHADAAVDRVGEFARHHLNVTSFERANADLNGDGRFETFVYATDPAHCGSGGCTLFVLSPKAGNYRVVMRATVTRPPIHMLGTTTRGWRDIGVTVAGGGNLRPYMARLRFNGSRYPSNPTVPPAVPLKRPSGKLLIRS
jgi:hypothetical protein